MVWKGDSHVIGWLEEAEGKWMMPPKAKKTAFLDEFLG